MGANELAIVVSAGDTDLVGYVYHANFFRFMEAARWVYLRRVVPDSVDVSLVALRTVVRSASGEFMKPVLFGETLVIDVEVVHVGVSSYRLAYEFHVSQRRETVARGSSVQVYLNKTRTRSMRVPDELRAALGRARHDRPAS